MREAGTKLFHCLSMDCLEVSASLVWYSPGWELMMNSIGAAGESWLDRAGVGAVKSWNIVTNNNNIL